MEPESNWADQNIMFGYSFGCRNTYHKLKLYNTTWALTKGCLRNPIMLWLFVNWNSYRCGPYTIKENKCFKNDSHNNFEDNERFESPVTSRIGENIKNTEIMQTNDNGRQDNIDIWVKTFFYKIYMLLFFSMFFTH